MQTLPQSPQKPYAGLYAFQVGQEVFQCNASQRANLMGKQGMFDEGVVHCYLYACAREVQRGTSTGNTVLPVATYTRVRARCNRTICHSMTDAKPAKRKGIASPKRY